MEINNVNINYEKRNFYLRIVIIIILLFIAISVLYFKYGYSDPSKSQITDKEGNKVVDCREALIYYAEKELHYNLDDKKPILPGDIPNITLIK